MKRSELKLKRLRRKSSEIKKFRFHRSGLWESMQTEVYFTSKEQLVSIIKEELKVINANEIEIKHHGYDHRNCWDTYIITLVGYGIIGFTNAQVN